MHFCKSCSNMYYIKLSDSDNNKLSYYCRNCGTIDENILSDNICVSKQSFNNNSQKIDLFVNKYTKLDPTLPRVSNIPCPNESCLCNRAEDPIAKEVIYIRYDDTNLKFVYLCAHCDTVWKSDQ